ncbi:hypothetical protein [Leucobacter sp. PH1c]|uniref:hypothetical protein n=1 Tax=Leucobacter sp. PH1c TaxID=1397278 RepID=UPI000469EF54|nr:hypothetical protein [Leucobacter sp. PH1c]
MTEGVPAPTGEPLLQHAAELLIAAYRDWCRHGEGVASQLGAAACAGCSAISEVHDMMRLVATSTWEASALRAHFERELIGLGALRPPRSAA